MPVFFMGLPEPEDPHSDLFGLSIDGFKMRLQLETVLASDCFGRGGKDIAPLILALGLTLRG